MISTDIYIKTEPVDPDDEASSIVATRAVQYSQTGSRPQRNVHVYSSPVLSSMLGSRPNPTPLGALWAHHGPSIAQGVDQVSSSKHNNWCQNLADKGSKSMLLQNTKISSLISNSPTAKQSPNTFHDMENSTAVEYTQSKSQSKNNGNVNMKLQAPSDKKHSALLVSMMKDHVENTTMSMAEPDSLGVPSTDEVQEAIVNFSMKTGLVETIEKVFVSVSREKSKLINLNGDGFSTISSLIADQILSKYLLIPKHVPVADKVKNEKRKCIGNKDLQNPGKQEANNTRTDDDFGVEDTMNSVHNADFACVTQAQPVTNGSTDTCTPIEDLSSREGGTQKETFNENSQILRVIKNPDTHVDNIMGPQTDCTEFSQEEHSSNAQTDLDIEIKMEVETDSECEENDMKDECSSDMEGEDGLSDLQTVHNTDGTMKILLPNPKVLKNFTERRGMSITSSKEMMHGIIGDIEKKKSNFSALKQALMPVGPNNPVVNSVNSTPCQDFPRTSPNHIYQELSSLQEKARIGHLTGKEKKKFIDIVGVQQLHKKQALRDSSHPDSCSMPHPYLPQTPHFDPCQELMALQEKARVGHLTEEEKKTFIDIVEMQQNFKKQFAKKKQDTDLSGTDPGQDVAQKDNLRVKNPMIPFTYEEDTSGLDRTLFYCFRCQICGKTFKHAGTLKVHERSHGMETEEFKCTICGKVCSAKSYLITHMRTHEKESQHETKYKCSFCEISFSSRGNLIVHERVHEGSKLYQCDKCDAGFTRKQQLKNHIMIHTGEKPFSCQHCDKKFRQSGSLKLHLNTHSADKPYKCDMCGVGFGRKVHYEKHVRKHKGIRPFECEECGKDFTDKFNLKAHQKIHNEKKDHVCHICSKGFNQSTHLKNHLKFHEGLTGYTCEVCDERFEQRAKLRDHVLDFHRNKEDYASKFRARRVSKSSRNETLLHNENSINSNISKDSVDKSEENADSDSEQLTDFADVQPERRQRSSRKRKINYDETKDEFDTDTEEDESQVSVKTEPVDYEAD